MGASKAASGDATILPAALPPHGIRRQFALLSALLRYCPCFKATVQCLGTIVRPGEVQFFLRLHGLWEGVLDLPPPSDPPFDIETCEPIEPPWQAILPLDCPT